MPFNVYATLRLNIFVRRNPFEFSAILSPNFQDPIEIEFRIVSSPGYYEKEYTRMQWAEQVAVALGRGTKHDILMDS